MPESSTIPGKAVIKFEAGDTLKRTITISSGGSPINLTGTTIEILITDKEDGNIIETLTVGSGLIATNLSAGQFSVKWQSGQTLQPRKNYYYKVKITYADGTIRTYLEDKLTTV